MDDAVNQRPVPAPIPVLSPALHCVAMTALVYLRTSFGYTFLRPKSVFFALSWAFVLFVIMAWHEPDIWREYRAVCIFGAGAVILYWIHFSLTFSREWRRRAEDDPYPGTSHALRFGFPVASEETLRFWLEPAAVLFASAALHVVAAERHLSTWLLFVAFCMVGREAINYWTGIRRQKVVGETIRKVQQQGDAVSDERPAPEPPKPTRTEPVKQKRNTREAGREERFAKILRLHPPYTLEKAEENFKTLVQLEHPDAHGNSPESNAVTAELNEAIQFFRQLLLE
jgi:hypothetical protein